MDLRLEGRVSLSLGERLATEFDRSTRAIQIRHRVGQVHEDRRPRRSRRSGLERLLEQSDRATAVTCLAMSIGAVEDAPAHLVDILERCEPHCQLGQLGCGSGCSPCVHTLCRLLDKRRRSPCPLDSGEPEVARSLLRGWNDLGEPRVQRPTAHRRLRAARPPNRAADA